jgi:hypothetical protein
MTAAPSRSWPASTRSAPNDEDRARLQALATEAVTAVRAGFNRALLDARSGLGGLHSASVKRVYLKLVLQGVVRWMVETQSRDDLMASAHHVVVQDGPTEPPVVYGRVRLSVDKVTCALLRAVAKAVDDASG